MQKKLDYAVRTCFKIYKKVLMNRIKLRVAVFSAPDLQLSLEKIVNYMLLVSNSLRQHFTLKRD